MVRSNFFSFLLGSLLVFNILLVIIAEENVKHTKGGTTKNNEVQTLLVIPFYQETDTNRPQKQLNEISSTSTEDLVSFQIPTKTSKLDTNAEKSQTAITNIGKTYSANFQSNNPTTLKLDPNLSFSENCYHIPRHNATCPDGFTYLFYNSQDLCYVIKEKQKFPPKCPFGHFLANEKLIFYGRQHFFDKTFWLHAFQNYTSGFPQFEWFEPGESYGETIEPSLSNPHDYLGKHCLVLDRTKLKRVSCGEEYNAICIYSLTNLHSSSLKSLCHNFNYDKCIIGDLSLTKCFCKRTWELQLLPKKNYCEKLAEPVEPYQNRFIGDFFQDDPNTCWFGLYKSTVPSSTLYKWVSLNKGVKYTNWVVPEKCGHTEGAIKLNEGWLLAQDTTLNCAICEVAVSSNLPQLELKQIKNELYLIITNSNSISDINGLSLFCFTDSNREDFKRGVNVTQVEDSKFKLDTSLEVPSFYWCESFGYSTSERSLSNIVVAAKRKDCGHEFAFVAIIKVAPKVDPFIDNIHQRVSSVISKQIKKISNISQSVRPMRGSFNESTGKLRMVLHITTTSVRIISDMHSKIKHVVMHLPRQFGIKGVSFLSSYVCVFELTESGDFGLMWPETKMGATAIPTNAVCLDLEQNMRPVTRKCEGNFIEGAKWGKPTGCCYLNSKYSNTTEELFELVNGNLNDRNITKDLERITKNSKDKQAIDVHLVSLALEKLAEMRGVNHNNFSGIISNVMNFEKGTLKQAQHLLNSTDKILSSLDHFMQAQEPLKIITPKLIVQITNLKLSNMTGLVLNTQAPTITNFESYDITSLNSETSFGELLTNKTFDTAVLFPIDNLKAIKTLYPSNEPIKLIIMVFFNDLLFNEQSTSREIQQTQTKIVSVTIPGFTGILTTPIKVAFKLPKKYVNLKNCSHWFYGLNSFMMSISGQWITNYNAHKYSDKIEVCEFNHMTHFGLLLQDSLMELVDEIALDILTTIGSALSLIGIIPIFITGITFKTWRKRAGNVILINFCLAIVIQIILLFCLETVKEDGIACKIIGASLHYMVLCEFFWMLVVAVLQYRRFVMVFTPQEKNIVKKCLVIGWGFPLCPVLITISFSIDNYRINSHGFCNVVDYFYIFCYILPIILILGSNAFIFTRIIYSVSKQSTETCLKRSRNYKLEILLALFLFFVLGITWLFGIIGSFGGGIFFTYVFCITATLRGLVLFLFFIAGNKETRLMWKNRSNYYLVRKLTKHGSHLHVSSNTTTVSNE